MFSARFDSWYKNSTVRNGVRHTLHTSPISQGLYFFPHDVSPILAHPNARFSEEGVSVLLLHEFHRYMAATDLVEHLVVNLACHSIAYDLLPHKLPDDLRAEAYQVYTDEAYHMLFCADIRRQVEETTQRKSISFKPPFATRLESETIGLPIRDREFLRFWVAVVTETMISSVLSVVPRAVDVETAIRQVVADHAADEARHNVFFTKASEEMWKRISSSEAERILPLLPRILVSFFEPDVAFYEEAIQQSGKTPLQAAEIVRDVFGEANVVLAARAATKNTIAVFRRLGAFEINAVEDAFHESGLLT